MEKAEILSRLKTFEANLADKEIESEERLQVLDKAWKAFDLYDTRLRKEDADIYEYDEAAFQHLELKQEKVYDSLLKARESAAGFAISIDKNTKEISKLRSKLEKKLPGILESYKKTIADYDEWLSRNNLSSKERARIEAKREEILEFEETDKEAAETARRRIEELEELNKELSDQIAEQEKIEASLSSEYERNDIKLEQIRTASKLTPEQRQQAEYEATMLYTRYKFLEMDPKKELSILISEYESGRITERDLILRLSDINEVLNTVMYDLKDVTTLTASEAVIERRKEIQARIDELEKKIDDKSNYRKQNKDAENRIWAYNKILAAYEPERNEIAAQIKAKQDEIKEYEDVLKSSDELSPIEKEKFASERAETKEIIDRKEKEIKTLELKLKNNKKREKETKATIMGLNEEFFDKDARAKDMALLVEQRALLDATYSEEALDRTSFISEFDGFTRTLKSGKNLRGDDQMYPFLRNLTPEDRKDAEYLYKSFPIVPDKPERQYPPFWGDLSDKQKEAYFDLIEGHTPEEIQEFNDGVAAGLAAEKAEAERLAKEKFDKENNIVIQAGDTVPEGQRLMNVPQPEKDAPVPPVPPTPPVPEPIKVNKFKDLMKEKLDKIKKFFDSKKVKRNIGKAMIAAGVAMLIALGIYGLKNANNKSTDPMATPTPPAAAQTVQPEKPKETPKPGDPDKPDVIPPVIDPTPTPTPNPTPTPVPTTGVINLETAAPVGTGDSAPADEYAPYLDGNAFWDTELGTYVDSDGTHLTRLEDGTFIVTPDAQTVTPNADGTVQIPENIDMSPIATPTPAPVTSQAPITMEEALESGAYTPEEAAMAQNVFDGAFAEEANTLG